MNDDEASATLQEYLCDCFFFFKCVSGHFSLYNDLVVWQSAFSLYPRPSTLCTWGMRTGVKETRGIGEY